jgi:hypothetical protein
LLSGGQAQEESKRQETKKKTNALSPFQPICMHLPVQY